MSAALKEKIDGMQDAYRFQVAHKYEDGEVLQRVISIRGSEETGYIASSEEWFVAEDKTLSEFAEVRFETTIYPTMHAAFMDALPSAIKEASNGGYILDCDLIDGQVVVKLGMGISIATTDQVQPMVQPEPEPEPAIDYSQYEISSGYVGALGQTYITATETTFKDAVEKAAELSKCSIEKVLEVIESGKSVAWQQSPNYYYDHAHGGIRKKRQPKVERLIACACGHSVPKSQVMSASLGTSCPDCYDRMSG